MANERSGDPATIIADLFSSALIYTNREADARRALKGDISTLYCWEQDAIRWLAENWEQNPDTPISPWTATVVKEWKKNVSQ